MAALVLGVIALAAVAFSFAFAVFVLALSRHPGARADRTSAPSDDAEDDRGDVAETMSRVLVEVERLATLRERGALTDKEFAAQKARLFVAGQDGVRPSLPQRAR